jgi:hypothetical protein
VWTILKCFYKKDAQYGEFYLCINLKDRLVKFEQFCSTTAYKMAASTRGRRRCPLFCKGI